ncbi:MAG TPA: dihydropteroate synthase [Terriglobales bacterium]|nr:dihydropteroate synthase [Terriglobales bacterium]
MRPHFQWQIAGRTLELGARTLVMGIVNVTPDSFSDGGTFFDRGDAVSHALRLLDEGADILDIGGESTRPGANVNVAQPFLAVRKPSVSAEEELARVIPVITEVKRQRPSAIISVDTYKAFVAKIAVESGAAIVNDVSGFLWDPDMAETCAGLDCGVVLMHMRGLPETWRSLPKLEDPVTLVKHELGLAVQKAEEDGIAHERIVLDPGFGFGKSFEENYPLLAHLDELASLGFPLLAGTSRKSFVGRAMGLSSDVPASERLSGSLAAMVISIMKGSHIVRVHDVKESIEAARVADAIAATCNE